MILIICVGYTPLHRACQFKHIQRVKAVMENGGDPDATGNDGAAAKDYCCRSCSKYDCDNKYKLIQGNSFRIAYF